MPHAANDLSPLDQQVMIAILRLKSSAYGVSIQKEISKRNGREFSIGAIYASLDRLERNGYVTAQRGESTAKRGGRAKLYFKFTAPGEAALQASLRAVDALRHGTRLAEART